MLDAPENVQASIHQPGVSRTTVQVHDAFCHNLKKALRKKTHKHAWLLNITNCTEAFNENKFISYPYSKKRSLCTGILSFSSPAQKEMPIKSMLPAVRNHKWLNLYGRWLLLETKTHS
jgi:hypothetical protein